MYFWCYPHFCWHPSLDSVYCKTHFHLFIIRSSKWLWHEYINKGSISECPLDIHPYSWPWREAQLTGRLGLIDTCQSLFHREPCTQLALCQHTLPVEIWPRIKRKTLNQNKESMDATERRTPLYAHTKIMPFCTSNQSLTLLQKECAVRMWALPQMVHVIDQWTRYQN